MIPPGSNPPHLRPTSTAARVGRWLARTSACARDGASPVAKDDDGHAGAAGGYVDVSGMGDTSQVRGTLFDQENRHSLLGGSPRKRSTRLADAAGRLLGCPGPQFFDRLPYLYTLIGRQVHLVVRLHLKRREERGHIADRAVARLRALRAQDDSVYGSQEGRKGRRLRLSILHLWIVRPVRARRAQQQNLRTSFHKEGPRLAVGGLQAQGNLFRARARQTLGSRRREAQRAKRPRWQRPGTFGETDSRTGPAIQPVAYCNPHHGCSGIGSGPRGGKSRAGLGKK